MLLLIIYEIKIMSEKPIYTPVSELEGTIFTANISPANTNPEVIYQEYSSNGLAQEEIIYREECNLSMDHVFSSRELNIINNRYNENLSHLKDYKNYCEGEVKIVKEPSTFAERYLFNKNQPNTIER